MDEQLSKEAVENLVTQFSSALDFYRELVQNSIDAGSSTIDVWMEYTPAEGAEGVIAIHVDDYGEGMNEEIIDQQLTRLFSSNKENDLTKIGKFGIGFVSVFALEPVGVLVHTGRDGEFWEVFFHADRSFTKTRIDTPVEGTQLTLFLPGDRSRYRDLVHASRATLSRWCSHSDTEVTFEDRSAADGVGRGAEVINQPFESPGEPAVVVRHPGTELALAYSSSPTYGFYNKGLALAVTSAPEDVLDLRADRYRHICIKIKSRYLEHTLSRETVMRDANYEKAMELLDAAAAGPLRTALVAALRELAASPTWSVREHARYTELLRHLLAEPNACLPELADEPILRTVAGSVLAPAALEDALSTDGWIFVAPAPSRLTAALQTAGTPVLLGQADEGDPMRLLLTHFVAAEASGGMWGWLRKTMGADHYAEAAAKIVHPEMVMVTAELEEKPTATRRDLLATTAELLQALDVGYRDVRSGIIHGRPERPQLFVLGRDFAPVMALPPDGIYRRRFMERPRVLVDFRHPHARALEQLHTKSPALAAYGLAKSLLLAEDRSVDKDDELAERASREVRGR